MSSSYQEQVMRNKLKKKLQMGLTKKATNTKMY